MRIPRIYTSNELAVDQCVSLEEKARKHVKDVLRMKNDGAIILFNGNGYDYHGQVIEISKKNLQVQVQHVVEVINESPLNLHLLQPLCNSEKMDLCIQKATELGVIEITPFISTRVNININANRIEKKLLHWRSVIQSACEQSERAKLPTINPPISYTEAISQTNNMDIKLIASPLAEQHMFSSYEQVKSCICAIGPEGGFTPEEIKYADNLGFETIKLGARVLRLETAVFASLTLCQYNWGDFK